MNMFPLFLLRIEEEIETVEEPKETVKKTTTKKVAKAKTDSKKTKKDN